MTTAAAIRLSGIEAADEVIARCMNPEKPRSFFLYAGAGSGKTRSLVGALAGMREQHARRLHLGGRKAAIITYTNAARDEIERRLDLDPLFHVSTIHSFCWSMIGGFHNDIRNWLKTELPVDINELGAQQAKGRAGTKAAQDRERSIQSKSERLARLDSIAAFTYNPNGDNYGKDSLSHTEVLKITSAFLEGKRLMRLLLVNRFPLLLIDESQDTNAALIEALFAVERQHVGSFALGLFGDMMQRIYADGKHDLGQSLPSDWEKPAKLVNHRSAKRIVRLGNSLRRMVDGQTQTSPEGKPEGHVCLFIARTDSSAKPQVEQAVRERMAELTEDKHWLKAAGVTALALEHHMAANRLGFGAMWQALYGQDHLKRGLIDGDLPGIRLFSERVFPVVQAAGEGDRFAVAELVKTHSPLLRREHLLTADRQSAQLTRAKTAVEALSGMVSADNPVTFREVLQCVAEHELFEIPEALQPFVEKDAADYAEADAQEVTGVLQAWRTFLECPYTQIIPYVKYVSEEETFDTHHGVKGLEFKRVIVLLDDSEARGFMYSYDKLLGVEAPSAADLKNEREGRDTAIARTRRLLYVTCTRAEESLAILVYSTNPSKVRDHVVAQGWFEMGEIVLL
jgi:DNA helicase II / ATP-dependent DNA helicase PcrA